MPGADWNDSSLCPAYRAPSDKGKPRAKMTSDLPLPPCRIEADGLAIARGPRRLAEGLRFAVGPGQLLVVRGPNGAGKSSLLACIGGALRPAAGHVTLTGGSGDAPRVHLLGHLAAVKARLSVSENLAFWADLNGGERRNISGALARVGLGHAAALDAGYLSAGQARRLAIARLLVADRPVWLLDEPLAALDSEGHRVVGDLIAAHLARGGLAVAATHDDLDLPPPAKVETVTLGVPA